MKRCRPSFWDNVLIGDDCWVWDGHVDPISGYGRYGGKNTTTILAHKQLWERINGLVPIGLELDHLCRNRACVRPSHLEAVTHQVNVQRGVDARPKKMFCKRGHALEDSYLWRTMRQCRKCRVLAQRKYNDLHS